MLLFVTEYEVPSPEVLDEIVKLMAESIGPRWFGVDGFHGAAVMVDRERLRFMTTSYWESRHHFEVTQSRRDTAIRVATAFAHAIEIRVETWDVAASGGTGSLSAGEGSRITRW